MKRDERIQQVENGLRAFMQSPLDNRTYSVEERMAKYHVPGVSVAVIQDGKLDWAKAYGQRSSTQRGAVNTDTLFQAASISKMVAALAIQRLFEARGLDIDADINTYLKSWKVPPVEGWNPRVTLRHLLSHTAGTTVSGFRGYNHKEAVPTVQQILDGISPANSDPVRVDSLPGTHSRYSGGGTTIAMLAVMDITGQSFPDIMREWALDPLGMTRSRYEQPLSPQYQRNAAHGHYSDGAHLPGNWYTMPELAAAGLWTTPTDIARFLLAVQQAYRGKHELISQSIAHTMLTIEHKGEGFAMGVGPFIDRPGPRSAYFGHSGGNVGYRCDSKLYFEGGSSGAVIMTNGEMGIYLLEEFFSSAARVYGWRDYLPKTDTLDTPPPPDTAYIGSYRTAQGMTFAVTVEGDTLSIQAGNQTPLELRAVAKDKYQMTPLFASVTFERDKTGSVTGLIFEQTGHRQTAGRVTDTKG